MGVLWEGQERLGARVEERMKIVCGMEEIETHCVPICIAISSQAHSLTSHLSLFITPSLPTEIARLLTSLAEVGNG